MNKCTVSYKEVQRAIELGIILKAISLVDEITELDDGF
jgi:hypothetical protein